MVVLGFCPPSFICANIIHIPKGYRSIAISSLLGKILDHTIIERQSEALKTSTINMALNQTHQQSYAVLW